MDKKEDVKVVPEDIEEIFKKKKEKEELPTEKFAAWNESAEDELPEEKDPVIVDVELKLKKSKAILKRKASLNINSKLKELKGRLKIASLALEKTHKGKNKNTEV